MKKLFLCFAICFGVFVCQNVVAQNQPASLPSAQQASPQNVQLVNPQNISFDKQVSTPGVGATPVILANPSNGEFDKMTKRIEGSTNPTNSNLSRLPLVNAVSSKKVLISRTK